MGCRSHVRNGRGARLYAAACRALLLQLQPWSGVPADSSCFGGGGIPDIDANGTPVTPSSGIINFAAGTNITLTPSGNTITITASSTGATAFSALTTGTAPANAALIATITTANACPTGIAPILRSANAAASSLTGNSHDYPNGTSATTWTVTSNATGLASTTAYKWNYHAGCYLGEWNEKDTNRLCGPLRLEQAPKCPLPTRSPVWLDASLPILMGNGA